MYPIIAEIRRGLRGAADSAKAGPMQAYMKTRQPFYGVQTPARRKIVRAALKSYPVQDAAEYAGIVRTLWQGPYREEMYCAIDIAAACRAFRTPAALPLYEEMLQSAENWDLVDGIVGHLVGGMVRKHRELEAVLERWLAAENFWLRRAALLAHLGHKAETNRTLLQASIVRLMPEKEFFIRKAIGWVLREYAKTDPEWVRNFVESNAEKLSALSKREALKHIGAAAR